MKNNYKLNIPLAIILTLAAVFYQRMTGPTYPYKSTISYKDHSYKVKLIRSHGGKTDAPLELPAISKKMKADLFFKRYPTNDAWTQLPFSLKENKMIALLPNQPPAGKLQYFVVINFDGVTKKIGSKDRPIIIRFKGAVPATALVPHIVLMFLAMLLAILAALEAWQNTKSYYFLTIATFISLFAGGMIFGPIVQKYAFGVYWAGVPFDWDLTDNKLLIAVIFWFIALFLNLKKRNRWATIIAAIVLIGIYSIPHSMIGSQYSWETNKVETDF